MKKLLRAFVFLYGMFFFATGFCGTTADAVSLSLNQSTESSLKSTGDVIYFKFVLPTDGYVKVNFRHAILNSANNYWRIGALNSNNKELMAFSSDATTPDLTNGVGLAAGTYYVRVLFNDDYYLYKSLVNEPFQVTVNFTPGAGFEKAPSNTVDTATPVELNTSYTGSLKGTNGVEYFKFVLPADGYVKVNFKHAILNSGNNYWWIGTLNSSNKELMAFSSDATTPDLTNGVGLAAGTYYVRVLFNDDYYLYKSLVNEPFQVTVNFTPGAGFEKAPSNTVDTATPIELNTSYTGSLKGTDGNEYFKFSLTSAAKVKVNFTHQQMNSANNSWWVIVINPQNQELLKYQSTYNAPEVSNLVTLNAGTYYVRVLFNYDYYLYTSLVNQPFQLSVSSDLVSPAPQPTASTPSSTNCTASLSDKMVLTTPCVTYQGKTYSGTWVHDPKISGGVYFRLQDSVSR